MVLVCATMESVNAWPVSLVRHAKFSVAPIIARALESAWMELVLAHQTLEDTIALSRLAPRAATITDFARTVFVVVSMDGLDQLAQHQFARLTAQESVNVLPQAHAAVQLVLVAMNAQFEVVNVSTGNAECWVAHASLDGAGKSVTPRFAQQTAVFMDAVLHLQPAAAKMDGQELNALNPSVNVRLVENASLPVFANVHLVSLDPHA